MSNKSSHCKVNGIFERNGTMNVYVYVTAMNIAKIVENYRRHLFFIDAEHLKILEKEI